MNDPNIKWHGDKLLTDMDRLEKTAISKSCIYLERDIKMSMKSTPRMMNVRYKKQKGKGKYKRGARRGQFVESRWHHPSMPGYPPAVDIGRLINSLSHIFSWSMEDRAKIGANTEPDDAIKREMAFFKGEKFGKVGTNVKYAIPLETGTRKMKMRPYIRVAFNRARPVIDAFFRAGKLQ